jgi:glyceraldehyde-3-phosphate dehydrogenase/erythrose-4-phosphate dehydrogenase
MTTKVGINGFGRIGRQVQASRIMQDAKVVVQRYGAHQRIC